MKSNWTMRPLGLQNMNVNLKIKICCINKLSILTDLINLQTLVELDLRNLFEYLQSHQETHSLQY
jgi:hypothetical protein